MLMNDNWLDTHQSEVYTNDDIDLRDDDVEREIVDRIPSIQLLDRVHNFLEESISKTAILKLLGRKIRFHALPNKIHSLWNPSQSF
ncbi:hypothetical protein Gorai_006087 [Gossypium raimondii]|uniref:Uncharacterized protein n=1 Tax=Gossypium raimondii TaxID=29730 RepID=A0A7J8QEB5_GOSRA|nr:hypothetical protein [Gossypium raimondii]